MVDGQLHPLLTSIRVCVGTRSPPDPDSAGRGLLTKEYLHGDITILAITLLSAYAAKPIYICMYTHNLPLIVSCPTAVQGRQTEVLNPPTVCKDVETQSIA